MDAPTLEQLKQLSFSEKLQLVEDLWDAIAEEAAARPVGESLKVELERRLDEHRRNPESAEPWDNVKAEIERRLS